MKCCLKKRIGFALVVCLAGVVLLLSVVLALFAQATANRAVEASRAHAVEVEIAARNALDYVVASFLSEIAGGSTIAVIGGETNYFPVAATNAVPARGATSSDFANLIRQSSGDTNASTHGSGAFSRNGRAISTSRWNAPFLLSGGGFTNAASLPNWIYTAKTPSFVAVPSTNAIGRFAYNVYDVGGLLDANVAGYPSLLGDAQIQQLKGTLAGADLTQLGLSSAQVDALISWRNPSTGTAGGYVSGVTARAAQGFFQNSASDHEFTSRSELIRWATGTWGEGTASNALPLLTHFTRELARPSLNTNGLMNMSRRYALSQLTNFANTGLGGSLPNLTYTNSLSASNSAATPDLFQVLRSSIDFSGSWETNGPAIPFSGATWLTDMNLKAVSIGANIIDQFSGTTQPTGVLLGTNRVVGKKPLPYVMQVFAVYNIESGSPKILHVSFVPQVWCQKTPEAATTITASLAGGSVSLGGLSVPLPTNSVTVNVPAVAGAQPVFASSVGTNLVSRGFFATNIPLTNAVPEQPTVVVSQLAFVNRVSASNAYSAFGTTGSSGLPVSGNLTATILLSAPISAATNSPDTSDLAGVSIQAVDPRTIRSAGQNTPVSGTNALSTPLAPVSIPLYPDAITDTNIASPTNRIASVGELGRAFRESPWRSIYFANPSSSDRALLDTFSAYPTHPSGLRAGTIFLNTRQPAVLAAILAKSRTRSDTLGALSGATAQTLASQMVAATKLAPLANRSRLVELVSSNVLAQAGDTSKESRETAIRALAEVGQTRTWNFLVDVIAQTGSFRGGTAASDFFVESERRYWLHVAIDRYTGRVVDQQIEPVFE